MTEFCVSMSLFDIIIEICINGSVIMLKHLKLPIFYAKNGQTLATSYITVLKKHITVRFNCNKCATLVGDVTKGGAYACV